MYEAIQKIKDYREGIVDQFNRINNIIPRAEQDEETRATLTELAYMIESIDKIISYLEKYI